MPEICNWRLHNRSPKTCSQTVDGYINMPSAGRTGFCEKHLGRIVISASEYADTSFSNMVGDKIIKAEKN